MEWIAAVKKFYDTPPGANVLKLFRGRLAGKNDITQEQAYSTNMPLDRKVNKGKELTHHIL